MEGLTAMFSVILIYQHLSVSANGHESCPQLLVEDKRMTLSEYFGGLSGFWRVFMRVSVYLKMERSCR